MSFLPVLDIIAKVVDKVIPDPNQRLQLQLELSKLADQEAQRESTERLAQIQTNTAEATNPNMFVAGWRPAVGWVCATGAGINFVVLPLASWAATVMFGYHGELPGTDIANLMALLGGMLGFGYLRSKDKMEGVEDSVIHTKKSAAEANAQSPVVKAVKKVIPDWVR